MPFFCCNIAQNFSPDFVQSSENKKVIKKTIKKTRFRGLTIERVVYRMSFWTKFTFKNCLIKQNLKNPKKFFQKHSPKTSQNVRMVKGVKNIPQKF